jgi:GPH family glycoside/pentoside/hexuronide:cation symporter
MTLGQSLAMILFTSISTVGAGGMGYRLTALVATIFCMLGGLVFTRYDERHTLDAIVTNEESE